MKYEPKAKLTGYLGTPTERLMMPLLDPDDDSGEPNWDAIELVSDCIASLTPEEQFVIYAIHYDRVTYEELATRLGLKAKSHAWRKARQATEKLKQALLQHPNFQERTHGKFTDFME